MELLAFVFLLCLLTMMIACGVGANAELRRGGILYTGHGVGLWVLAVVLDALLFYCACLHEYEPPAFLLALAFIVIVCAIIPWPRSWGGL